MNITYIFKYFPENAFANEKIMFLKVTKFVQKRTNLKMLTTFTCYKNSRLLRIIIIPS